MKVALALVYVLAGIAPTAPADAPEAAIRIRLADGRSVTSHGPDPARAVVVLGEDAGSITCVPRSTHHFEAILARAYDDRDRPLSSLTDDFRQALQDASARMDSEAVARGGERARYRFWCDAPDRIAVRQAVLPTRKRWTSFSTIVRDLDAMGHNRPRTKYLIFYDDCIGPTCFSGGIGTLFGDDRLSPRNASVTSTGYGVDFGAPGRSDGPNWFVILHESGHTMGAVQESAPHYSGNGHCWDGLDVMCYSDGGYNSGSYSETSCPRPGAFLSSELPHELYPFDCGGDDYFNPRPPAQSYISDHWNLAHRYNRFLDLA